MAKFTDVIQAAGPTAVDKANRVDLGDITLAHGRSWTILRAWAEVENVGTTTPEKPLYGYVTLQSEDCDIEPFEFPFAPTAAHLGNTPHMVKDKPYKFPINCPAPAGAVIECYVTLSVGAPVGAPECTVTIEYGDGSGQQIHMKTLEPSGALGTADNAETTMSTITIKSASKLIGVWGVAGVTTPVADEAVIVNLAITCDEFRDSGPLKFPLRSITAPNATTGWGGHGVEFLETDRDFKGAPATAVIQPTTIQYDANNAAPEAMVGVAYI